MRLENIRGIRASNFLNRSAGAPNISFDNPK
jgi:hypothetical protein